MAIEDEAIAAEVERMLTTAIQRSALFIHHSQEQDIHLRGRDWVATLDAEPYSGGGYRIKGVKSVSRKPTGTANGAPQPSQGESEGEDPSGAQRRAVRAAAAAEWGPEGPPATLVRKDQRRLIRERIAAQPNLYSPVSDRTIDRELDALKSAVA